MTSTAMKVISSARTVQTGSPHGTSFHAGTPAVIKRKLFRGLLLVAAISTTGCSAWQTSSAEKDFSPWSPSTWFKKEYQEPASIAAIWSPDTLATAGEPTMRGFGGRIYFYNERSQAVPVEGDLVVHGYLTTPGNIKTDSVDSDKRFVFGSERLTTHFSPSQIGASYSIWVPWDEAEGYREEVTLIATFKSKQGTVVQGTPAKLFLPGKSRVEDALPPPKTQTVSFVSQAVPTHPGEGQFGQSPATRTTTIEIPDHAALARTKRASYELGTSVATGNLPANVPATIAAGNATTIEPPAASRLRSLTPPK